MDEQPIVTVETKTNPDSQKTSITPHNMVQQVRDLFSIRYVVVLAGVVELILTITACVLWLRHDPTPEVLDRWWGQVTAFFIGTLTTTSTPKKPEKD